MSPAELIDAIEHASAAYKKKFGTKPQIFDLKFEEAVGDENENAGDSGFLGIHLCKDVTYNGGYGSKSGFRPHGYFNFEYFIDGKGKISDREMHVEWSP